VDKIEVLQRLSDGQTHTINELIEGRAITRVDFMLVAQEMSQVGWVAFEKEPLEPPKPWLKILPVGQQALAAHHTITKAEMESQA
jgi:hypothetical protein